jgi:RecB family endonuclease NucS
MSEAAKPYSGRLNAFLPESTRLLMLKDDGSVLISRRPRRVRASEPRSSPAEAAIGV